MVNNLMNRHDVLVIFQEVTGRTLGTCEGYFRATRLNLKAVAKVDGVLYFAPSDVEEAVNMIRERFKIK